MLGELNVIEKRAQPRTPETFVSVEDFQESLPAIVDGVNRALHAAVSLMLADDAGLALKWMAGLYALALTSRMLGSTGLFFVGGRRCTLRPSVARRLAWAGRKAGHRSRVAGEGAWGWGARANVRLAPSPAAPAAQHTRPDRCAWPPALPRTPSPAAIEISHPRLRCTSECAQHPLRASLPDWPLTARWQCSCAHSRSPRATSRRSLRLTKRWLGA
jgi:hypothetical protein